jgi:hypothetical protein
MSIAGRAGAKVKLRFEFLEGRCHLPIIKSNAAENNPIAQNRLPLNVCANRGFNDWIDTFSSIVKLFVLVSGSLLVQKLPFARFHSGVFREFQIFWTTTP